MNGLDLLLIIPLGLAALRGFQRGLIVEIFSIMAVILAFIVAMKFTHVGVALLEPWFYDSPILPFAAYLLVFLAVLLGVKLLAKVIDGAIKVVQMGLFNRMMGLCFALLKASFILSIILWLAGLANVIPEETEESSLLYPYIAPIGPWLVGALTEGFPFLDNLTAQIQEFFTNIQPRGDGAAD